MTAKERKCIKSMTYLQKDSINYETWLSLVLIGIECYNIMGWDNLCIQETKRLYYCLNIALDEVLFKDLHNYLEYRKVM